MPSHVANGTVMLSIPDKTFTNTSGGCLIHNAAKALIRLHQKISNVFFSAKNSRNLYFTEKRQNL